MWQLLRERVRGQAGATAVEYGIMVALIAVVIIGAVWALGDNLSDTFQRSADCVKQPTADGCPDPETDPGE